MKSSHAPARLRALLLAAIAVGCLAGAPAADAAKARCPKATKQVRCKQGAKCKAKKAKKKKRCKRPSRPHGTSTGVRAPVATAPQSSVVIAEVTAAAADVSSVVTASSTSTTTAPGIAPAPAPAPDPTPTPDPAPAPDPPARGLFASDSVWNAALRDDAPVDATSSARVGALVAEVQNEEQLKIGPWIDERSNSTPFYVVGADQPKVPLTLDSTNGTASLLRSALSGGVPIPDGAHQAAGTDAHMTVYQPSTDTMWEFFHASQQADGWHADWGGVMQHVSTNPGYYSNEAFDGLAATAGWNWGSTASSLPMIGGTVMIKELEAGHIDHALAMNIPNPCATWFSWPAQRTDGTATDTSTCMVEGAHLRLDPSLDLSKLNLPPVTRMFAEAAQKYGIFIRDKTGKATGFFAEDPTPTGTDPYRGPDGFYGGISPRILMSQFPWESLKLLNVTGCWKAPCLPPAS